MYEYIRHREIDYTLWDECINHSSNGTIYALSWYLNVASPKWDALIKMENGIYSAVVPLPLKKKFGYKILFNPVFCHQLGLFCRKETNEEDYKYICRLIEENFRYVSGYNFNVSNTKQLTFNQNIYQITCITSYHLPLQKPYTELFSNFSKDRQRNIIKSKAYRTRIEESDQIEPLIELFKANVEGKIYGGVKDYQYQMLSNLWKVSRDKGVSKLLYVKTDSGQLIYGCLLFIFKNLVIKFFNAGNEDARRNGSDAFFMDYLINKFSNSHYILDLERASSSGVNAYKESFSPQKVTYVSIRYNNLPFFVKSVQKIRSFLIRSFVKGV